MQKFSEHIEKLQIKFNAFAEKAKYYFLNPDELINNTLSKLFGKEVKIKFKLLEKIKKLIKDCTDNLVEFDKLPGSNGPQNETQPNMKRAAKSKSSSSSKGERSNALMAIFQGLIAAIELDGLNNFLKSFGSSLGALIKEVTDSVVKTFSAVLTTFNCIYDYVAGNTFTLDLLISGETEYLRRADGITNGGEPFMNVKRIDRGFSGIISFFKFILDIDSAGTGNYSKTEDIIMATISFAANIISIIVPNFALSMLISSLGDLVPEIAILIKKGFIIPV